MVKSQPKKRNYSFVKSKKLPTDRMTEINGIKIPAIHGSCYHGILCTLASNHDKFCRWEKIYELTEKFIRQYGGHESWYKFKNKRGQSAEMRIKENVYTLTRAGRDCYGFRLHEQGMVIYFFKDGAILFTGGTFKARGPKYNVIFEDKKTLQSKYRGSIMTFKEYTRFLELGYIDPSGTILDHNAIADFRKNFQPDSHNPRTVDVCITVDAKKSRKIMTRLQKIGLYIDQSVEDEILGQISIEKLPQIKLDKDVLEVEVY